MRIADKELAGGRNPAQGPFNIQLRSPEYAELQAPVSNYLRFKAPMDRKLKEIATMLTARYWGGQYVWYSHRQQALDAINPPVQPGYTDPNLTGGNTTPIKKAHIEELRQRMRHRSTPP